MNENTFSCLKLPFNEFISIMDDICGLRDSYGYYWDIASGGEFFRKNNPEFTFIDMANYFDVNVIHEIFYHMQGTTGYMYILYE